MDRSMTTFETMLAIITTFFANFWFITMFWLLLSFFKLFQLSSLVQLFSMLSSTWPEFCTTTGPGRSCLSPLTGYSGDTCMVEDDDVFGASCSNRTVFLNLLDCSSFAISDPHLPMWMSLIMFSSCCLSSSPDRPHVDPPSSPHSRVL